MPRFKRKHLVPPTYRTYWLATVPRYSPLQQVSGPSCVGKQQQHSSVPSATNLLGLLEGLLVQTSSFPMVILLQPGPTIDSLSRVDLFHFLPSSPVCIMHQSLRFAPTAPLVDLLVFLGWKFVQAFGVENPDLVHASLPSCCC